MSSEHLENYSESYFQVQRHEMLEHIPQDASLILDVGCASGMFGQLLKAERSVEIWGVEPSKAAAAAAAQHLDKVICAVFDRDLNLPQRSFDCIVLNDVIEHLVDPYSALDYCKELLKIDGVVVASIPNVRYFDNMWNLIIKKDWEYADYGILDRTHLRFFTQKSIVSTFESLSYDVELIQGINPLEKVNPNLLRRFNLLDLLSFRNISDMRYLQFAVVARPRLK